MKRRRESEVAWLRRLTVEWQKRLRIQDWTVEVNVKTRDQMTGVGSCSYGRLQSATIEILTQKDLPSVSKNMAGPSETWCCRETTLVHELLHLRFRDAHTKIEKDSPIEDAVERAIDATAQALVALKRRGVR